LIGRSARQGDPGTGQFFLSLEDELLEALGPRREHRLNEMGRQGGNQDWIRFQPLFLKAQKKTEKKHYRQRLDLMFHEKQRKETLEDLGADPYVD
jgi:preprotein translocase subunit SecA